MRKFKLLKDISTPTLNIPAGSVFEEGGSCIKMYLNGKIGYESEKVENNPDWFEEVQEKEGLFTKSDLIMLLKFRKAGTLEVFGGIIPDVDFVNEFIKLKKKGIV